MTEDVVVEAVQAAGTRWLERERTRRGEAGKPVTEVESASRIAARIRRLTAPAGAAAPVALPPTVPPKPEVLRSLGLERTIGASDFQSVATLELALAVSRFVGRINLRSGPGRSEGFGTGFMVSPRLLMTNNHVLPMADSARHSEIEFDYQIDRDGRPLPVVPFSLRPDLLFMTDETLDFTLVAVAETSRAEIPIRRYGWSRLIGAQGKILKGEHMNIIQHPKGQFKQFVTRRNELIDLFDDYAHYVTDTEQGSSGAPVYNDQWEVVALHHSGVPRMEGDRILNRNGEPWDGVDPDRIDWVANEGIRVSSLIRHIEAQRLAGEAARLRDEMLSLEPPHPIEAAQEALAQAKTDARARSQPVRHEDDIAPSGSHRISVTIPLRITLEIGAPEFPTAMPLLDVEVTEPAAVSTPATGASSVGNRTPRLDEVMARVAAMTAGSDPVPLTEAAAGSYTGLPAQVEFLSDGRRIRLLAPLAYTDPNGGTWAVPSGTVADGASIPRAFWSVIGGPLEGRYRDASIVHDRFCVTRERGWEDTHRMFYWAMRASAVSDSKARVMFYAVWRFGPRWTVGAEALALAVRPREITDADAASILDDVARIQAERLGPGGIEKLVAGREGGAPKPPPRRRGKSDGSG